MPFAFAAIALFRKLTISGTLDVDAEPPHLGVGMPRSAAASWNPYWVGTKNGLLNTWFTNQNCHLGVLGKFPTVLAAALLVLLAPPLEPQAASSAEAAAVALTRPAPLSSFRREGLSFIFSVSIASSTFGSTFLIEILQDGFVTLDAVSAWCGEQRRKPDASILPL
jgi:hypothetical protein